MEKNTAFAVSLKKHPPLIRLTLAIAFLMMGGLWSAGCSSEESNQQNFSDANPAQTLGQNERRRPTPPQGNPRGNNSNVNNGNNPGGNNNNLVNVSQDLDTQLRNLVRTNNTNPARGRNLPAISDPLPQLGMQLFYSKSLSGGMDVACVSCHHPTLGGGDQLSLPIGVEALNADLLGLGRSLSAGGPLVGRNAPTVFNSGLWNRGMFWDSRVERLGRGRRGNDSPSGISTPDSGFEIVDPNAGPNLPTAQARFPVTSAVEMRTEEFENDSGNAEIRTHLAARIGDYGIGAGELILNEWLPAFQTAFDSQADAETLITFDNIAIAIAEFERSMVFVETPWREYLEGDNAAISDEAKQGAVLFFSSPQNGGAGCSRCHRGPTFTDGEHHTIAYPQIGRGKGDGETGDEDYGRERVTGRSVDRFRFRTPSLLNVEMTAPYTHSGAYFTLEQVINHYDNPNGAVRNYFRNGAWCNLPQFERIEECEQLYPNALDNSLRILDKLQNERQNRQSRLPRINLDNSEVEHLAAFLRTLTDPCLKDRACLAPWTPDGLGPDGNQLNAVNASGEPL